MAPVSAADTTSSADQYDSAGLPWDARIHNKSKTTKKDGTWKLAKGIEEKLGAPAVAAIVQELAQRRGAPTAAAQGQSNGTTQTASPVAPPVPVPPASVPTPPPPPPVAAAPAAAPDTTARELFKALMGSIVAGQTAQKLQPLEVAGFAQKHGALNMGAVAASNDVNLLVAMKADIDALIASRS